LLPPYSALFPYTTLFRSLSREPLPIALDASYSGSNRTVLYVLLCASPIPCRRPRTFHGDGTFSKCFITYSSRHHRWVYLTMMPTDRKSTRLNSSHVSISY